MRLQLAQPDLKILSPDAYNQLFSMHGVTMIFLYALPMLSGFSNFLWPLLLGSRDMAFPRLNALSYWIYLCAGIFLYVSVPLGQAPNGGWFNYVPNAARPTIPASTSTCSRSASSFSASPPWSARRTSSSRCCAAARRACRSTACPSSSGAR